MAERVEKPPQGLLQSAQPEIYQTPDPRPHYLELDALRGIGVLVIVVTHSMARWDNSTGNPLTVPLSNVDWTDFFKLTWGPFCLTLFFLLSGYLLAGTEGKRASRGNYSLRSYALRRALRLVPAYYFALALSFLLWSRVDLTFTDTLAHLTFLHGFVVPSDQLINPVIWSLTPEVVFYAMLPLLILRIRGLYGRLALFGVLVAVPISFLAYTLANAEILLSDPEEYQQGIYLAVQPLIYLWIFVAGVLLRMLVEHLNERSPGGSWPTATLLLSVAPLVLLALVPYVPLLKGLMFLRVPRDFLAISFFAAVLLGIPALSRILSWRPFVFLGMISYSLFLLHTLVLLMTKYYVLGPARPLLRQLDGAAAWVAFAGYLGSVLIVAVVIAYLSFRYIESPFMRIKPK